MTSPRTGRLSKKVLVELKKLSLRLGVKSRNYNINPNDNPNNSPQNRGVGGAFNTSITFGSNSFNFS